MDCSVAKLLLSEFLDEALPAGKDGDLRGHLQACPGCSGELAGLKVLSGLLKALPRPPLPQGFMGRLHKRKAVAPEREPRPFAAPRALAFGLTAVLAVVIVYRAARPSSE